MPAFAQPSYAIRPAEVSEAALIAYLRLASLLCLEMPGHALDAIRAVMTHLPDVDADLVAARRYYVADHGGDLLGGAGWSALPPGFRGEKLVDECGRPATLLLGEDSVLVRGFFLDPDLGRRGAGAALLAQMETDIAREGFSSAELIVPVSSQIYYRSLGFKPVRKLFLRLEKGDTLPLLQMRRYLTLRLAAAA